MDEFKRYVAKQNSFLIYGKTKLYEISITWIEKKKCYMLHVDKDYFCKNSEEMLALFYCGYPLEKWIKEGEVLLCIRDEEAEKFALQRYIISQYQERCRKKLKQGYCKNERETFWEFLAKRPEILNKNTVKAISEKEFKNELKKADNKVQGYMIGSNGWFKDCFYAGEMKTLAVYVEKYLEELDFSMIFNEKGGILQYVTSDEGKVEREYCRLI